MKDKVLILLRKLCDSDMEDYLTKKEIIVIEEENKEEVTRGNRDDTNEMRYLNIHNSAAPTNNMNIKQLMNSVCELKKQKKIINYMSQAT